MKANDLMIGDWVNSDFGILQITEIFDDCVRDNRGNDYEFDCIHPILLTGDILKRNGFELVSDRERANDFIYLLCDVYEYKNKFKTFTLLYDRREKDYSLYTFGNQINNILYVHELQNAMRVCGVEKEVDICQH